MSRPSPSWSTRTSDTRCRSSSSSSAMAYAAFADAPVDAAVVEVGMGGSWDATNVADATRRRDHADRGRPRALPRRPAGRDRAREGRDHQAGRGVDRRRAGRRRAGGHRRARGGGRRDGAVGGRRLRSRRPGARGRRPADAPARAARRSTTRCSCRCTAPTRLRTPPSPSPRSRPSPGTTRSMSTWCERRSTQSPSPGRLEVIRRSPTILLDAAHNPHGAAALVEALHDSFMFDPLVGVVGVMADKDFEGMLAEFEPVISEIVCTQNSTERAMPAEELAEIARGHLRRSPGPGRSAARRRDRDGRDPGRDRAVPSASPSARAGCW